MTEIKIRTLSLIPHPWKGLENSHRAVSLLFLPHPNHISTCHPFCHHVRGNGQPDDRSEARRNFAEAELSTSPGMCSHITQLLLTGKRMETSGQIRASIFQGKINTSICCRIVWPGILSSVELTDDALCNINQRPSKAFPKEFLRHALSVTAKQGEMMQRSWTRQLQEKPSILQKK